MQHREVALAREPEVVLIIDKRFLDQRYAGLCCLTTAQRIGHETAKTLIVVAEGTTTGHDPNGAILILMEKRRAAGRTQIGLLRFGLQPFTAVTVKHGYAVIGREKPDTPPAVYKDLGDIGGGERGMTQRKLTQTLMIKHKQTLRSAQQQTAAPGTDIVDMKILPIGAMLLEGLVILADRDDTAMSTDEIGAGSYPLREDGGESACLPGINIEDSLTRKQPLMAIAVDECLTYVQTTIECDAVFRLHMIVVDAKRQPWGALTGNPSVTVGQREDAVETYGLPDGRGNEPVDIDIGASPCVEEIEPPVVGCHPHIVAVIGMERIDTIARQHVDQAGHTAESSEAIAVVVAESAPRAKPHQPVVGLSDTGDDVGSQAIA